jgi:hypothetical protein
MGWILLGAAGAALLLKGRESRRLRSVLATTGMIPGSWGDEPLLSTY